MSRFTIKDFVLPFTSSLDSMEWFEDIKSDGEVFFALQSEEVEVLKAYENIAKKYKEQFLFFHLTNTSNSTNVMFTVGMNFRAEEVVQKRGAEKQIEDFVKKGL
mmetsp:Transcript_11254/g.11301  ORF Transcript_11254/g.11301 Transcript_11254/m.11301 type:complete len:104 (-) Transcript_11254:645-956(-)